MIAGGRSNLTYRITDATGRAVALRRPPGAVGVRGAHDVGREYRVQAALRDGSAVRVPPVLAHADEDGPLGVPFYLMEFVDGVVVRDAAAAAGLPEPARRACGLALVDQLVDLHRTDPARIGLGDLGRPDGYLERQLRRWRGQIPEGAAASAALAEVHEILVRRMPSQRGSALLHGDFRLDNVIVTRSGQVRAVLDWELSTQGDPLADLGWLLLYWRPPDDLAGVLPAGSELPGFADGAELAARYAAGTGTDLSDLPYYLGFAAWRLAVITLGVAARYVAGARAGGHVDVDRLAGDVRLLTAAARRHLAP
nr:phosphotransferase family protein [Pseudonocardia sp. C8]